ncbi:MAG: YqgE/AlgH family protein [Bacteroidota bacterium]
MAAPEPGILLISDPFLKDPNFQRTVILLCEHEKEGSLGFVINKLHNQVLGDLMEVLEGCNFPVFLGGPVQKDSLHFIHRKPDLLGGIEIIDGIFWGGDFDLVLSLILTKELLEQDIRFFIGYSGWGSEQLEEELAEKTWITTKATRRLAFYKNCNEIWKEALFDLGGEYQQMINYPKDPQLN